MTQDSNRRLGYLLAAASACVWAGTSPGIAFLLSRNVPSLTIALWRDIFIASFMIAILALARPSLLQVNASLLRELLIAGAISIGLYHALWVWSVQLNGVAVAVVLIYLYPAFVTLGACALFKERIGAPQIVALGLAVAGCALVVRAYDPDLLQLSLPGLIVGLLTAITHTFYVLFNQHRVQRGNRTTRLHPLTSLTYTMTFGAATLFFLTLLATPVQLRPPAEPATMLALIALALGPTMGGYALFTIALRHAPARIASLIVVMEVPIATLIAVAFLGEKLEWPQVAGMIFILTAAVLPGAHAELAAQRRARAAMSLAPAPE
ncbi:MAG: DMT family transporter [Candidatus Brachytrichaceae bacterium NZ_4S206]